MSNWISRVASRVDDQWCDKCQRVCCDCHISHRAELAQAKERIAELEAALNKAKKMHDWFTHTVPQWDKSTQKAMEEFDKALAATQEKGGTR